MTEAVLFACLGVLSLLAFVIWMAYRQGRKLADRTNERNSLKKIREIEKKARKAHSKINYGIPARVDTVRKRVRDDVQAAAVATANMLDAKTRNANS